MVSQGTTANKCVNCSIGDDQDVQIPRLANDAYLNYSYSDWYSVPLADMNNREHIIYAGKAVGGGTAINGMLFDRGAKSDYDAWKQLGNPGWGFDDLLPYFKKVRSTVLLKTHQNNS